MMKRRNFLKMGALSFPFFMGSQHIQAAPNTINWDKTLVLLELKGGNDGLNTVVPFTDGRYYDLRQGLALDAESLLGLDKDLALNPALVDFKSLWDKEELGVILGLGYPEPNRSHFRSIDIWDSASDSSEYLAEGWVSQLMSGFGTPDSSIWVDGLILGGGNAGPLHGTDMRTLSMNTAASFLEGARDVPSLAENYDHRVLNHIVDVQNTVFDSIGMLDAALVQGNAPTTVFPNTALGQSLRELSVLMANGIKVPAVKVSHGSFDTHSQQLGTHANLLTQLSEALAAFRLAMIEIGKWDQVAVQTYSEFGRRAESNASGGTDHGTAAPQFLLGGKVRGGIYGSQPSLNELDGNGDLVFTTDFRSLYASLAAGLWEVESPFEGRFSQMDLFY